jgi:hypothetical protein
LKGDLTAAERARLIRLADYCPLGQTLGTNADIHTREDREPGGEDFGGYTSYEEYLAQLPVVNIDPD